MRALRPLFILAVGAVVAGCDSFTGVCTTDFRFGIVVEVRDAVSGAPAADGARLIVRDGDYVETVDAPPTPSSTFLQAAGERVGRYDVTVQKPGYAEWTRTDVQVLRDGCHVTQIRLDAQLQPTG